MTGLSPCVCDQSGCGAMTNSPTRGFDLRVEGDSAEGVLENDVVFLERI
jgi:hypothetical protein